ncbi:hypothetical protein C8R43DRAFT_1189442 [Mycena crocata]|nr:hypothetical protein C8R43DRAFT_1189442 [Mycena crocata]
MSGAERQSMERRTAPSWPCEGYKDWGDAWADGMEGAKLAMRGMDGLGRRVDGWDGGRQVGHARYEGTQGGRTLDGYLPRSLSNSLSALPTYDLRWLSVRLHSHDDVRRDPPDLPVLGRTQQSPSVKLAVWTKILAFIDISRRNVPAEANFDGGYTLLLVVWTRGTRTAPYCAGASSSPPSLCATDLKSNCFTRLVHVRWTALGRLRAIMILNMCIASGSAYALASDGNVQAPGFEWTDQSSIVATSRTRHSHSKTPNPTCLAQFWTDFLETALCYIVWILLNVPVSNPRCDNIPAQGFILGRKTSGSAVSQLNQHHNRRERNKPFWWSEGACLPCKSCLFAVGYYPTLSNVDYAALSTVDSFVGKAILDGSIRHTPLADRSGILVDQEKLDIQKDQPALMLTERRTGAVLRENVGKPQIRRPLKLANSLMRSALYSSLTRCTLVPLMLIVFIAEAAIRALAVIVTHRWEIVCCLSDRDVPMEELAHERICEGSEILTGQRIEG